MRTTERNDITRFATLPSPVGELLLLRDEQDRIAGLHFAGGPHVPSIEPGWVREEGAFGDVRDQLGAYFAGERCAFELPLGMRGSEFQRRVWAALREIPYGETASYGEVAKTIGRPAAARAVGAANARNPVSIIVPCHRVIGSSGTLTGYGGGLERKRWLLALEDADRSL